MIVIWVIGVSGSGKSFFSKKLFKKLKRDYKKTIWIDVDLEKNILKIYLTH